MTSSRRETLEMALVGHRRRIEEITGNAAEEPRFSLLEIEAAQAELVAARMDAELIEDPEERSAALVAVEQAIAEYSAREIQKVDSYRRLIRALTFALAAAKDERDRQAARVGVIGNLINSIKEAGRRAMEVCGKQRIDGRTGSLILKGNGGVQPLVISNPDLIPDELCRMEGWIRADLFALAIDMVRDKSERGTRINDFSLARVPDNEAIRKALSEVCGTCCGDTGGMIDAAFVTCGTCGGSGRNSVPGAYLGERGNHIEVR